MYFFKRILNQVILVVLFGLIIGPSAANGQMASRGGKPLFDRQGEKNDKLNFELRTYNTAADNLLSSRLIVQLGLANSQLQFIKADKKKFSADFKVVLTISDTSGQQVTTDDWQETVFADSFDETVSPAMFTTTQEIYSLAPGYYDLDVMLTDLETKREGKQQRRLQLKNFKADSIAVSDVLFLNSVAFLSEGKPPGSDEKSNNLYAYFEVYNVPAGDSLKLDYLVFGGPGNEIKGSHDLASIGAVTSHYLTIKTDSVSKKDLKVSVDLRYQDQLIHIEQALNQSVENYKSIAEDLDKAIEVLIYVAKKKEIKELESLKGEEKVKAFRAFWEKLDPTPDTPENEYMSTYYSRIEAANAKFTDFTPGWKTQMGMVYVKLGAPDFVDRSYRGNRNSFSRRAMLLWYYPRYNRYVAFQYMTGEYRIANQHEVFDLIGGTGIRL